MSFGALHLSIQCYRVSLNASRAQHPKQCLRAFDKLASAYFVMQVLRGGHEQMVEHTDVVVGDLLLLDTGDKVSRVIST
jgi:magnesium-transporting ATPase (P-type)